MKIGEAFPSKWIKAADLGGQKVTVTIDSTEMANVAQGEDDKLVVYFRGKKKGFVLNVTNANMIAEITGSEETEDWPGHQIALYPTKVDYSGRRVDAIRVDYPAQQAVKSNGQPRPLVTRTAPPLREPGEDDVPAGAPVIADDDVPW